MCTTKFAMLTLVKAIHFLLLLGQFYAVDGKKKKAEVEECTRADPFGMQSGALPDQQITSSSAQSAYPARLGRLGHVSGAWCAAHNNKNQWLQIDLGETKEMLAVATEGLAQAWVTHYYLQYSLDLVTWFCFGYDDKAKILASSQGARTVVMFSRPIARYVRLNPQAWHGRICLRAELYGCSLVPTSSFTYPSPMQGSCDVIQTTQPPTTTLPTTQQPTALHKATTKPAIPIQNLRIRIHKSVVKTDEVFLIGLYYHEGDNVRYKWNLGDGMEAVSRTNSRPFPQAYNTPGVYMITVLAHNSITNVTDSAVMVVQDPITELRLADPIAPMEPTTKFKVSWNILTGTNVSFTLDFGNGASQLITEITRQPKSLYTIYNQYPSIGHFKFTITAQNRVSPSVITRVEVIVENALEGLTARWNVPRPPKTSRSKIFLAVGEEVSIQANVSSGTGPWYQFDFGENTVGNLSVGTTVYKYSSVGTYSVGVTCFNHINSLTARYERLLVIQADEKIRVLSMIIKPAQLGKISTFFLTKSSGTAFTCDWSFGDGFSTATDIGGFSLPVLHLYKTIGQPHLVTVCCENRHGKTCIQVHAKVEIPIKGLKITSRKSIIMTNTTVSYDIEIQNGSHVTYEINFGDGQHLSKHFKNTTARDRAYRLQHNFTDVGVFTVRVDARNSLGHMETKCSNKVIVQNPIIGNLLLTSNSPVKLAAGKVTVTLGISERIDIPTNASCMWNFGENTVLKTSLTLSSRRQQEFTRLYTKEGRYLVKVNCSNMVSASRVSTTVIVHKMITPKLTISRELARPSNDSQTPDSRRYFARGETVRFCVTTQEFDLSYTWFSLGKDWIRTNSPCWKYYLNTAGVHHIRVHISHTLENTNVSTFIIAQEKIAGLYINASETSFVRTLTIIYWSAENFGTDACFYFNLNDTSAVVVFGSALCSSKKPANSPLIIIKEGTISYKHKYRNEGRYRVTITGLNMVSSETKSAITEARKPICKVFDVEIKSNNQSVRNCTFRKNEAFALNATYNINCIMAERFSVHWKLLKILGNTETEIRLETHLIYTKRTLNIPSKELAYGIYKIVAIIDVSGTDIRELYGDVSQNDSVSIKIISSPLKPIIKGGSQRHIDPESWFTLDGMQSFDPDDKKATFNLGHRWYCRTRKEADPNDKFVGCYRKYNNPQDVIGRGGVYSTNSNEFARKNTYIYTLEILKEGRVASIEQEVFINYGNPPSITLSCLPECTGRLIPVKSLVLLSECTSCSSSARLSYKWEVFQIATSNSILAPVKILPSQTRFGLLASRLEILPNVFAAGKKYIVVHSVWKHGGPPVTANYTFTVYKNTPPKSGDCSVSPITGLAMDTPFVMHCMGWVDADGPLTYTFYYKLDKEIILVYSGPFAQWSFKLPVQQGEDNSTVLLVADVQDSLLLGTRIKRFVLVNKRKKVDLTSIMDALDGGNMTTNTTKLMSVAEMVQLTNTVTYSLNQASQINRGRNESNGNDPRKAIREKVTLQLRDVVLRVKNNNRSSVNELDLVSNALKDATQEYQELTKQAVMTSLESVVVIASILKGNKKEGSAGVTAVATKLVEVVGNILGAVRLTETSNDGDEKGTNQESNKDIAKQVTKKVLKALDDVGTAVLSTRSVGDPPVKISTANVNLTLEKNDESSISNKTMVCSKGSIKLPTADGLNFNSSKKTTVNIQLLELGNPFKWSQSSENVTSPVIALALKKPDGAEYNITNTKEYIEINFVSNNDKDDSKQPRTLYTLSPDNGTTRFHQFNWKLLETSVNLEFVPESTSIINWVILMAHGQRPSASHYAQSWSISSTPNATGRVHAFQLTRDVFKYQGLYHASVRPVLSDEERLLWRSGHFNISYSMEVHQSACWYWNERENKFSTAGCKVGPNTDRYTVQCLSKHLTSFASQFFVAPNAIDFDKAIAGFMRLSENHVAFAAVMTIFGVYLLLLVWAYRKDRQDADKVDAVILKDNDPRDRFIYEITVFTGMRNEAGTTSDVYCMIVGNKRQTRVRALKDPDRQRFQRSGIDTFILTTPVHLGELGCLKVWHNNTGANPSWYVEKIAVRDIHKDQLFYFICGRWLAVEYDDGQVARTLPVAKQEELEDFSHLFYSVSRTNFTDSHLWVSVFTRPTKSRFTRVQRLSCCLTLMYCTMLTNAMFYGLGEATNPSLSFHVGPFTFSARQIYIGIVSSLIIFPANLCIVGVFRSVSPKNKRQSKVEPKNLNPKKAPQVAGKDDPSGLIQWYKIAGVSDDKSHSFLYTSQYGSNFKTNEQSPRKQHSQLFHDEHDIFDSGLFSCNMSDSHAISISLNEQAPGQFERKTRQRYLPYWFIYIGWFGAISLSLVSAFFVTLYGFQFGKEKASQWLTSMMISFLQDVLISQPIKVIFVASFFALFLKKLDDDQCDNDNSGQRCVALDQSPEYDLPGYDSLPQKAWSHSLPVQPPNMVELNKARSKRIRELEMNQIVKELVIYVLFLSSLLVVSYGHRDPQAFHVAQLMTNTYLDGVYTGGGLKENDGVANYWSWLENTILPSLSSYKRVWAPGCEPRGVYSIDCNSRVVGTARLRQLRIPADSCKVPRDIETVTKVCNDFYSFFGEDEESYLEGWKPSNKSKMTSPNPWKYNSMSNLGGYPYVGLISTYSGGGYTLELRNTQESSLQLEQLKKESWIDQRTRALFLEISIYNAQVNMFGIATFLTEWIPTNGILYFNNIKVARLYVTGGSLEAAMLACKIFLLTFLFIFIYGELKKIYKQRRMYFKDVWNWLEVALIALIIGCAVAVLQRAVYTDRAIKQMQQEPDKFVSLIQAATLDELLTYFLGLLVFVANMKLLKLCRFNHRVFLFTKTLSTAASPLMSFLMVFFIFYIAYASIYYLIFGKGIYEYSSLIGTIESLFSALLGGFDYMTIENENGIFGPLLFFSFMVIMVMILMNVFLSILMDAFAEVQADDSLKSNEYNIVEFMVSRLKQFTGIGYDNKVGDSLGETHVGTGHKPIMECFTEIDAITNSEEDCRKTYRKYNKASVTHQYRSNVTHDQKELHTNKQDERVKEELVTGHDHIKLLREHGNGEDLEGEGFDALDYAIMRSNAKTKAQQKALNENSFDFKNYRVTEANYVHGREQAPGIFFTKGKTISEKLHDLTAWFSCVALDDLIMDRAYEELLRFHVKDIRKIVYWNKIKRQVEFSQSWNRSTTNGESQQSMKKRPYSRHLAETNY